MSITNKRDVPDCWCRANGKLSRPQIMLCICTEYYGSVENLDDDHPALNGIHLLRSLLCKAFANFPSRLPLCQRLAGQLPMGLLSEYLYVTRNEPSRKFGVMMTEAGYFECENPLYNLHMTCGVSQMLYTHISEHACQVCLLFRNHYRVSLLDHYLLYLNLIALTLRNLSSYILRPEYSIK